MFLFEVSVFLSAFLLFQIQPMIGKLILPWFGGTPAVWSAVMLFFQVFLTGGYAYAHWLIARIRIQHQSIVQIILITLALLALALFCLTPDINWKPRNVNSPVLDIFKLLIVSIGLPYFILAANSPLTQAWFSYLFPERSYARLYALSNAGSLAGLLAYPILIEPVFSLRSQVRIWALGFGLFGLLAGLIAVRSVRTMLAMYPTRRLPRRRLQRQGAATSSNRPSLALVLLWVTLSATASLFLLSVTNQITQDVAAFPFLWVLPLTLYLLSFILAFSGEHGYSRKFYAILFIISIGLVLFIMFFAAFLHVYWQLAVYGLLLFAACMLCHGELYRLRPAPQSLTTFYLMLSIGGAAGGIFVTLIAPLIFNGYQEFFVGLGVILTISLVVLHGKHDTQVFVRSLLVVFVSVTVLASIFAARFTSALYLERNFYGALRVRETIPEGSTKNVYMLSHGITVHGFQFTDAELRQKPTAYYVQDSGVGLAILNHPRYKRGQRVGMLGMGVGTLTVYGQPGDVYRLYEINPAVAALAEGQGGYFLFLSHSQANLTVILGDARLSLEHELAADDPQNFDVLVLDTFSSDAIPVHLITKEAFALYLEHLASDGIIAVHISNRHLDLQPVLWQLAQYHDLSMVRINYPGDSEGGYSTDWILLARDPALLENPPIQERAIDLSDYSTDIRLWTDNYSNLFQILK
jgi:spermidine synthase